MIRAILVLLGLAAAALIARAAYIAVPASGALVAVEPTGVSRCDALEIAPGTEDVTIDPSTGRVFVSAANRRADGTDPRNGIYAFSLDAPSDLRLVSVDAPADFRPHGVSLWRGEGEDGATLTRLFVINHPAVGHQVLIFDVADNGALSHVETVSAPAISSPNDVLGVGPRAFYVTNDVRFRTGVMSFIEALLGLPFGDIAYFDGETARIAAKGFAYANGINMSADGETLYASALMARKVFVFRRDPETGALSRRARIRVPLGLDNIETGPDGALYIGGHPDVFAFLDHAADARVNAPSQVVRLDPQTRVQETVFYSDGSEISASSVGAVHDGRLVVGAVYDPHVLICPLAD